MSFTLALLVRHDTVIFKALPAALECFSYRGALFLCISLKLDFCIRRGLNKYLIFGNASVITLNLVLDGRNGKWSRCERCSIHISTPEHLHLTDPSHKHLGNPCTRASSGCSRAYGLVLPQERDGRECIRYCWESFSQ